MKSLFLTALIAAITALFLPVNYSAQSGPAPSQNPNFRQEEVTFKSGKITLSGTLTIPNTDGKHQTVVLIGSSTARNRDYNNCGFDMFKAAADYFSSHDIEVLRFDLRGTGKSGGSQAEPSLKEMASDLKSALNFLSGRKEVDAKFMGVCGHGEGAAAAAMTVSELKGVSFFVMMNGPVLKSNASSDPALRYDLKFDPSVYLSKLKCNVLAAFGGRDLRVPAENNSKALELIFKKSGHRAWEIKTFPEANHIFQQAVTGNPDEYGNLKKEYIAGFLEYSAEWINGLAPREGRR